MTSPINGSDQANSVGYGGLLSLTGRALAAVSGVGEVQLLTTDPRLDLIELPVPFAHIEGIDEARRLSAEGPVVLLPEWTKDRKSPDWLGQALSIVSGCTDFPIALVVPAAILARLPRMAQAQFDTLRNRTAFIIERDSFGLNVNPSFGVASWVVAPTATQRVRMFACTGSKSVQAGEIESDFSRLIVMDGGATEYGYVLRQGIPAEAESLSVFSLDPKRAARRKELESLGEVQPLQTWYKLAPRTPPETVVNAPLARSKRPSRRNSGIFRASDIRSNGTLGEPSGEDWTIGGNRLPVVALRENDILVSRLVGPQGRLRMGIVKGDDLPAVSDTTVLVLRPRVGLDSGLDRFIRAYLASDAAGELIRARNDRGSAGIMRIEPRVLLDLEVPSPDSGLLAAILEVDRASDLLESWLSNAKQLLAASFNEASLLGARRALLSGSLELKDRVQLAVTLDDPDLWLLRSAPLPIAFRWRTVVAMAQSEQADELARVVLGSFESSLSYYAQITIAMAQANGLDIGACGKIRQKLRSQREGTAIGDWVAVLTEVSEARIFRKLPEFAPLGEIREVVSQGSNSRAAVEQLKKIRNDRAHDRNSASSSERLSIARQAMALQRDLLIHASRATGDLRLNYVRHADWDSISRVTRAEVSILKGDHWVVAPQYIEYSEPLEAGSLYIRDSSDRLHLMRPLLCGFECPECHTFSTFYADANFDGQLSLKSIEHGHSALAPPGITDAMVRVGML